MYDAAVIGTGPAGLSAVINLKLHNKNFVWFGTPTFSSKVEKSEKIANYPGMGLVTGRELNQRFAKHCRAMDLVAIDKMVTTVTDVGDHYILLAENDIYETRTLLLATGVVAGKGFQREEELLGHGVSYCATCDGFLYRNKIIAVYCGDRRYEHEVAYLAELADKVYLSVSCTGCGVELPNVEQLPAGIQTVLGEKRVNGIRLKDGTERAVDGLFCLRSAVAPAALLPGLTLDGPHIVTDRAQRTNLSGCFAAGDCTGRPYQIAKAIGEGNVAAHTMLEYLSEQTGGTR